MAADIRVLVAREDNAVARQTAEILKRELLHIGWSSTEIVVAADGQIALPWREGESLLVGLGAKALASVARAAGGRPVVGALVSRSTLEDLNVSATDHLSVIALDQPAERWLALIQAAFPGRQQVGILGSPANLRSMRNLERRASERHLGLTSESLATSEDLVPRLSKLLPRIGVLLALPDPLVHNRNTVQPLLLTTYRAGVPVVGYSDSYLQAGCTVALYSTAPQIGRQVMETLKQVAEGQAPPSLQPPRYYTVGVNEAVSRSLELSLPSAADLEDRLHNLDQ